jgi:hypothetical protein
VLGINGAPELGLRSLHDVFGDEDGWTSWEKVNDGTSSSCVSPILVEIGQRQTQISFWSL